MDNKSLIKYYKSFYERKVFHTRLISNSKVAHIMFTYDYAKEFENFSKTFLMYLPYYVRNYDQLSTISEENIDDELIKRSKVVRVDRIIPQRRVEVDGLYGELFLDFYLRIVCERNSLITYAQKRNFSSNEESRGPDNVTYFIENEKINVCFCEAKFVGGATNAKINLIDDINGTISGKPSHISKDFLNNYIGFMISQGLNISEKDKKLFSSFIRDLNSKLDASNNFIDSLIYFDICCNFIFFAIFDSTRKKPDELKKHYDEIYENAEKRIKELELLNYKIEIVFVPTNSEPINIKKEIVKEYE